MELTQEAAPRAGDQTSLAHVLLRVAERDERAFSDLYSRTSAKLYGVIANILGRGPAAEEALQDVYVRVWARAGDFDPRRASPIAWLAAIARNRAIDEARRQGPPMVDLPEDCDWLSVESAPLAERERSEALRSLLKCLDRLDAQRRESILLAYCRGFSRDALARRFDKPAATIKTWLRRGLLQIRDCMSQ